MIVFRICKTYPPDHNPIDGIGAFNNGGRWNSKGTHAVYTASTLALARAELARHVNLESIPDDFRVYEIEIPDNNIQEIKSPPANWQIDSEMTDCQKSGDKYLQNPKVLAIKVPSVCDQYSFNFILNPLYEQFMKVKITNDYPFVP